MVDMLLTIHDACWDAQSSPFGDSLLSAGAGWYKCVDDPTRAFGVASTLPRVNVIYRKAAPSDLESLSAWRRHPDFPTVHDVAAAWVRLADVRAAPNLWVEGHNEPVFETLDDVLWFARVEAERAKLLAARGLKAVVGNFATGNPQPGFFRAFILEYLNYGGPVHAIGVHEYGTIDLDPLTDRFNWLGHTRLAAEAGARADGFTWLVTECGLDRVKVGDVWRGEPGWRLVKVNGRDIGQRELWDVAKRYNAALAAYGRAKCACWFTYGDTERWKEFEMANADEFNQLFLASVMADAKPAPTNPAPNCTNPNAPADWTHTVDAAVGLNVRSTPEVPPATAADPNRKRNVVCAMPTGQLVRVIDVDKTWAKIDFPTNGWCSLPNLDARPITVPVERKLAPAFQMSKGDRFIDVSAYQTPSDMDWSILRHHEYRAVMIRLAIGLAPDPVWMKHWINARDQLARFGYSVFTFTATPSRQADVLSAELDKLIEIPTVAIDLETSNPSKSADGMNQYIDILTRRGVPLAWYGRASWVAENLKDISALLRLPFIVAHYKHPFNGQPLVPPGATANAWQYVAGEKVVIENMYWGYAKTRSGKFLDESVVMAPGLTIHAA